MPTELSRNIKLSWQILFAAALAYFAVKLLLYHYYMIIHPFPLEYREASMIMTADAFLKGIDPFALKNQPIYTNVYGIVYPLVVYPFAKIWGATTYVHRTVSAFFAFADVALIALILRQRQVPVLFNICACIMFYALLLFPATITATAGPNTLGILFFLLTLFIPWRFQYSTKSLLASAILALCAFYTKPYFIMALAYLCVFLFLFVSKRKAIIFAAASFMLLTLSMLIVHNIFEMYFNNVIFIHTNATSNTPSHLHLQLGKFYHTHQWLLIFLLLLGGGMLIQWIIGRIKDKRIKNVFSDAFSTISVANFRKPLINSAFDFALFCGICSFLLLYFRLGRNTGSMMWYFFHLLSPFVIIVAFGTIAGFKRWQVLIVPFLIYNLYVMTFDHQYKRLDPDIEEWRQIANQIDTHQNILNSPIVAPLLVHQNKPVYDSGLSEYFKLGAYRHKFERYLKPDGAVMKRHYEYYSQLKEMLQRKEFDLALITRQNAQLIPNDLVDNYDIQGSVWLPLPHCNLTFEITVWTPKK